MSIVVVALIRQGDEILMVKQQGEDDVGPSWSVPGGVVEEGEPLSDALKREVLEETGIGGLTIGRLEYVVYSQNNAGNTIAMAFNVEKWRGTPEPNDPDGLVIDCRFVPVSDAVRFVEKLPYRMMREPLHAYLKGATEPGVLWEYV